MRRAGRPKESVPTTIARDTLVAEAGGRFAEAGGSKRDVGGSSRKVRGSWRKVLPRPRLDANGFTNQVFATRHIYIFIYIYIYIDA